MIDIFRGEYDWLSNFYMRPISVGGVPLKSNEHFYHSCRTVNPQEVKFILDAPTAYEAKKRSRTVTTRSNWHAINVGAMAIGLWYKFTYNLDLQGKLLLTGDKVLIEGNWWHDNFWGDCKFGRGFVGVCERCQFIKGQNKLGKLHMQLRSYYQGIGAIVGYS